MYVVASYFLYLFPYLSPAGRNRLPSPIGIRWYLLISKPSMVPITLTVLKREFLSLGISGIRANVQPPFPSYFTSRYHLFTRGFIVSVIIVNYNTFKIICECIESVIKYTKNVDYEIVLVDNASTKDNADDFLLKFPMITLIKSEITGEFAKGNNVGINHATGDILLLLNSDTYLIEDSISKATQQLQSRSDVGALTVRLIYPDGKLQHTARKFRSIKNEILDLARPFLKLMPYKKRSQLMLNQYFRGDYNTYCDWVSGTFMMFRKNLLDKFPGKLLDERFFMYGEDQLRCYQFTRRATKLLSF